MFQKGDAKKAAVGSRTYPTGGSQKSRPRFRREINGSPKTGSRRRRAPKLQKAPPGSVLGDVFVCFLKSGSGAPRRTNRLAQLRHVAETPFVGRPVLETPETVPTLRPLRLFFSGPQTRPEASKSSPGRWLWMCFVFECFWRCGLGTPPRTNPPAQLCHVAVDPSCIVVFAPDWYKNNLELVHA